MAFLVLTTGMGQASPIAFTVIIVDILLKNLFRTQLRMSKSLAEFRRPEAAEENQIVFPAACTSEKLFARSERRRSRQGPRRKRSESPLAEKASAFFDKFSVVCYQDLGLPALRELAHDLRRQAQLPQLRPQGGGLVPGQGDEQPAGGLGVEEDLLH